MKIQFQQKVHAMPFHVPTPKTQMIHKNDSQQKDTLSIGPQARLLFNQHSNKNSLVDSLMKQRENLLDMKSKLTERALEKGEDPSSLQEQMKEFEKQLADLDAQIAQAQKEKQESTNDTKKEEKPKTVEEAIFSHAGSLGQTKTLQQMDRSLTREKASLESEMKLDASRGVHSEYKADRLAKIDDQMTFVQDSLTQQVSNLTANETTSETDNLEPLTVQEQVQNKLDEKEEQEITLNQEDPTNE